MVKKVGQKRTLEESQREEEELELEREMAAIKAIEAEKAARSNSNSNGGSSGSSGGVEGGRYNREGLQQFLEGMETAKLPFIETYQICQFDLDIKDEHDDLEREVSG